MPTTPRDLAGVSTIEMDQMHRDGLRPDQIDLLAYMDNAAVTRSEGRWMVSVNWLAEVMRVAGLAEARTAPEGVEYLLLTDEGERLLAAARARKPVSFWQAVRAERPVTVVKHLVLGLVMVTATCALILWMVG